MQGEQKKISHQNYRDIHDRIMKSINTKYSQIRPFRSRIFTIESQKTSLVKFDSKRYWIDGNKSVAFGSPRIKSLKAKSSMKKTERIKKNVKSINFERNNRLIFNFKKLKESENIIWVKNHNDVSLL